MEVIQPTPTRALRLLVMQTTVLVRPTDFRTEAQNIARDLLPTRVVGAFSLQR